MADKPYPIRGLGDWWNELRQYINDRPTRSQFAADVDNPESEVSLALSSTYATTGEVRSKAKANGTDQTAVVQAEINALIAGGGGTLVLPNSPLGAVPIKVKKLTIPNNGDPLALQPPLRIIGQGPHWSTRSTAVQGGTILEFTESDTYGLLKTNGLGILTLEGITFRNTSTAISTPFIYTTNTTLHVRGCGFVGAKSGTACDQDAIILGGPNQIEGGSGWTDGFQGYGTVISDNFFDHIRRAVYGRAFANSVVVRDNCVWRGSGSLTAGAIEFDGRPTGEGPQLCAANVIEGNLIEANYYAYGIVLRNASGFYVAGNGIWDALSSFVAGIWLADNVHSSTIIEGYTTSGKTAVLEPNPVTGLENRIITRQQGEMSKLGPTNFADKNYDSKVYRVKFVGGDSRFTVQPDGVTPESGRLLQMKRSAAEATNPGADVFTWQQNGTYTAQGANAGNRVFKNAAGVTQTSFSDNGRRWNCDAGGTMRVDTGAGGVLDVWSTLLNVKGAAGSGGGGIYVQSRSTDPATPSGGGILFVAADGALKYKGSAGTVTTIAPA